MDCGRVFVMWLGRAISPDFMTQVCSLCSGVAGRQHPIFSAWAPSDVGHGKSSRRLSKLSTSLLTALTTCPDLALLTLHVLLFLSPPGCVSEVQVLAFL